MALRIWCWALASGLFLLSATSVAEDSQPLSQIIKAVEDQGYSPVKVELQDGAWKLNATKGGKACELTVDSKSGETLSVEEQPAEDQEGAPAEESTETQPQSSDEAEEADQEPGAPLAELEWLVGEWIDEGADASIRTSCRWTRNRHFLAMTFSVESEGEIVLEGTQVVGWDPISQVIRSWTFDSEGGFSQGTWSQDGDHWNVKTSHTLATGERASAINVFTYVDENSFRWQSLNREIEGEIQPNIPEVTIVRQAAE